MFFFTTCSLTTGGYRAPYFGRREVWGVGQDSKGRRWMPWHQAAKKGAAGCEKPRGAASKHRSVGTRMGQPGTGNTVSSCTEENRYRRQTRGSETSQYPEEKKSREIPQVAASERGGAQT